ncbi:hypothetical protein C1646_732515, partial [Rhizophagus diaphanus]
MLAQYIFMHSIYVQILNRTNIDFLILLLVKHFPVFFYNSVIVRNVAKDYLLYGT